MICPKAEGQIDKCDDCAYLMDTCDSDEEKEIMKKIKR